MKHRVRTIKLSDEVWVTISGRHYGKKTLHAEIYIDTKPFFNKETKRYESTCQTRNFFYKNRRELFAAVRLALAKGTEDIWWDEKIMKRLSGGLANG